MSKTVIFGGGGFIGTALRALMDKQSIGYIAPTEKEINLEDFYASTLLMRVVEHGDTIIFISAYTNEKGNPFALTEKNIRMAANMVAALKERNVEHFVYISSDSVYGHGNKLPPWDIITEDTLISPSSLYGFMHATREQYFRETFSPENLTIIRPCAVYGIGDTHNAYGINSFLREAKEKSTITLFGNGEENRSAIYIDDLANIILKASQEKIAGIFNANCGICWRFKEIAEFIKLVLGDIEILSKKRTVPIYHRYFNNSKLKNIFHSPMIMNVGIMKLIEQYRTEKIL